MLFTYYRIVILSNFFSKAKIFEKEHIAIDYLQLRLLSGNHRGRPNWSASAKVGRLDLRHRCELQVLVREAPKEPLELFYGPIDLLFCYIIMFNKK